MVSSWVESEWDDEQLDMIRAEAEIARLTGDLGEWLPDATDPKADPMEYSGFRFVPDGPHTNWAKKAQLDAMDELKKKLGENGNVNGVYFGATRTDY